MHTHHRIDYTVLNSSSTSTQLFISLPPPCFSYLDFPRVTMQHALLDGNVSSPVSSDAETEQGEVPFLPEHREIFKQDFFKMFPFYGLEGWHRQEQYLFGGGNTPKHTSPTSCEPPTAVKKPNQSVVEPARRKANRVHKRRRPKIKKSLASTAHPTPKPVKATNKSQPVLAGWGLPRWPGGSDLILPRVIRMCSKARFGNV